MEKEKQILECQKSFVSWKVFVWIIGIILIVFGWVITAQAGLASKLAGQQINSSKIEAQLSQIQTDLTWIKMDLQKK